MAIQGINNNGFSVPESAATKKVSENQLRQADFLKLLVAQIKNQDPMNPQDGGKFLSDMAQFSTVDGINRMSESMGGLTSTFRSQQALFASSLVGREVMVQTNQAKLTDGQAVQGVVDLPFRVANLNIEVKDAAGNLVKKTTMQNVNAGLNDFSWDGKGAEGNVRPNGEYTITAKAFVDGVERSFNVAMADKVQSVSISQTGGYALNLANQGEASFDAIKRIGS